MLIGIANNKGGTGKSTLALLLASQLISYQEYEGRIVACDLDREQLNFSDMIHSINNYNPNAWKRLTQGYTPGKIELIDTPMNYVGSADQICICDMPPVLLSDPHIVPIVRTADLLIIPVRGSRSSVQGAERLIQIREAEGLLKRTRVVVNEWRGIPREQQVYDYLQSLGVAVLTLQRLESLTTNIDCDRPWFYALRNSTLEAIESLVSNILKMEDNSNVRQ